MLKFLLVLTVYLYITVVKGLFFYDFNLPNMYEYWDTLRGEVCNDKFIPHDISALRSQLKKRVFGQPFVQQNLLALLENHVQKQPKKPLTICMHGWTGGGKNYVTNIIISAFYKLGVKSQFVHYFSGRLHFPLSSEEAVAKYKVELQNWIRGNVSLCPRSIFVFDEIDKISPEIIDSIKPFFDYYESINNVDYRESIFVFLSNAASNLITKKYIELWKQGIPREKMMYKEFELLLRQALYNMEGAFEKSSALEDHLISLYLPFLPLEKSHVRQCIEEEVKRQDLVLRNEDYSLILDEMEFYNGRFSISGCKRVADQVAVFGYSNSRHEF